VALHLRGASQRGLSSAFDAAAAPDLLGLPLQPFLHSDTDVEKSGKILGAGNYGEVERGHAERQADHRQDAEGETSIAYLN
jgi:hypothetical protein